MKQTQLAPGVRLTTLPAEKFCKSRVTLDFIYPASRQTATADALLALVMERGYAACPDMTQLSKKLAGLYGAPLSVDTAVNGEMRVLRVTVTGLQDAFALHGEALGEACVDIALGTAFTPVMENGVISPQFVAIEKQQLRQQLESERNDKRVYCLRKARRRFFGTSRAGIEAYGYLEEVDGLCAGDVTQAFFTMLREAQIDVYLQGVDAHMAAEKLRAALDGVQRAPRPLAPACAMPHVREQRFSEPVDAVQGKLCLMFTAGTPLAAAQLSAMRVAVALLGGTTTSRLFVNVREKQSLCYYCAASYTSLTGALCVDSGVEHANAAAAREAGRDPKEILLVGASKMNEAAACREAIAAGIDVLGENRVQEMTEKLSQNAYDGAPLHFIGHLQRNKVKQVVGRVELIESVGSAHLLDAIEAQAAKLDLVQDILLEVNIGGEESKSGIAPEELPALVKQAAACPHVRLRGLMSIPPVAGPDGNRPFFAKMRQLYVDIRTKLDHNGAVINCLSMGMSGDYPDAIREGATLVRVGTAIFGARNYNKV